MALPPRPSWWRVLTPVLLLLAVACSPGDSGSPAAGTQRGHGDSSVAAFYVTAPMAQSAGPLPRGSLVLVQADGALEIGALPGVSLGRVAWSRAGLWFTDQHHFGRTTADSTVRVGVPDAGLDPVTWLGVTSTHAVAISNRGFDPGTGVYAWPVLAWDGRPGSPAAQGVIEGDLVGATTCAGGVFLLRRAAFDLDAVKVERLVLGDPPGELRTEHVGDLARPVSASHLGLGCHQDSSLVWLTQAAGSVSPTLTSISIGTGRVVQEITIGDVRGFSDVGAPVGWIGTHDETAILDVPGNGVVALDVPTGEVHPLVTIADGDLVSAVVDPSGTLGILMRSDGGVVLQRADIDELKHRRAAPTTLALRGDVPGLLEGREVALGALALRPPG